MEARNKRGIGGRDVVSGTGGGREAREQEGRVCAEGVGGVEDCGCFGVDEAGGAEEGGGEGGGGRGEEEGVDGVAEFGREGEEGGGGGSHWGVLRG